jgi:hypothetical protein
MIARRHGAAWLKGVQTCMGKVLQVAFDVIKEDNLVRIAVSFPDPERFGPPSEPTY